MGNCCGAVRGGVLPDNEGVEAPVEKSPYVISTIPADGGSEWGVSPLLAACFEHLEKHLDLEGLFRIPGSHAEVSLLKQAQKNFISTPLFAELDPHSICQFIKAYFRSTQQPLFTFILYTHILDAFNKEKRELVIDLVRGLPKAHLQAFLLLFGFLAKVAENPNNSMSSRNLATVFAPTLLRAPAPSWVSTHSLNYEKEVQRLSRGDKKASFVEVVSATRGGNSAEDGDKVEGRGRRATQEMFRQRPSLSTPLPSDHRMHSKGLKDPRQVKSKKGVHAEVVALEEMGGISPHMVEMREAEAWGGGRQTKREGHGGEGGSSRRQRRGETFYQQRLVFLTPCAPPSPVLLLPFTPQLPRSPPCVPYSRAHHPKPRRSAPRGEGGAGRRGCRGWVGGRQTTLLWRLSGDGQTAAEGGACEGRGKGGTVEPKQQRQCLWRHEEFDESCRNWGRHFRPSFYGQADRRKHRSGNLVLPLFFCEWVLLLLMMFACFFETPLRSASLLLSHLLCVSSLCGGRRPAVSPCCRFGAVSAARAAHHSASVP